VNDAAVAARDLPTGTDLAFDDHDGIEALRELKRASEADHASADHDRIDCFGHH
jgi:hypothetical protein